ncbi:hypothetical protein [Metabacillus litoralis]|uniref:hypothetical protein n=1 Tax=Metabacillus litoralis TaxID=152268 RepID=UPI0020418046|nr:hypothetical protein [Metabacillus litoralis]MCM3652982.1 hypothetical protein [Metabacillus litoralis]
MSNKWFLLITGALLTTMLLTGCADDPDPAPEDNSKQEQQKEENTGNEEGAVDNPTEDKMGEEAETDNTNETVEESNVNEQADKTE